MSRGSLQAMPVKLTPKGAGFASKPSGKGPGVGRVGHRARTGRSRSDSRAWPRSPPPLPPGNSSASRLCAFITSSMPWVARERDVLAPGPPRSARVSASRSISSEMSRLRLAVLDRARALVRDVPVAQVGQRLHAARAAPRLASHLLKSRFMPYLKTIEQSSSLPFPCSAPRADVPRQEVAALVLVHDARDVGGIDDDRALLLEDLDGLRHHLGLSGFRPPRGSVAPGGVILS